MSQELLTAKDPSTHHRAKRARHTGPTYTPQPITMSGSGGKKITMKIKPFKRAPKTPADFEESNWAKLQSAISAIQNHQHLACGEEELYKATSDLCMQKFAPKIYPRVEAEIEKHVKAKLQGLLGRSTDAASFFTLINNCWNDHCSQMRMIRSILLYLDRTYVVQTPGIPSLWEMGMRLFRDHIMSHTEVERKTVSGLLSAIEKERRGEATDRGLIKNLLRMLSSLGVYDQAFEQRFLIASEQFYKEEASRYMEQTEPADYLQYASKRLQEESERIVEYLDPSTGKLLISAVETPLLEDQVDTILSRGFDDLVSQNRTSDLALMYELFARVDALGKLRVCFGAYIKRVGQAIVMDDEKDSVLVQELLTYKAKLSALLEDAFTNDAAFANAMKEAFESFINARQNKPAELLAKFIDLKLRSGNKGQTEEELESTLDAAMTLFRYIQGKDVFEAFYKKDLGKRLLLGRSASFDSEKSMIAKLKQECGNTFTSKLEGMFKDIDLSRDIMTSFKQSSKHQSKLGDVELSVNVLTTGTWPAYTPMDIKMPADLAGYQEVFKEFYLSKHNGRRLVWQTSLGHCVLKSKFASGRKELSVSLFQALVLLLFNSMDRLTYTEIRDLTGIEDNELRRTLLSVSVAKVSLLKKEPRSRQVEDADVFTFNSKFAHKLFRIKVNQIQMKETAEEQKDTTERVFQDRQYQIDAAVVRIMKTRKTLTHQLLIAELYNQLKFPVKPADLKKQIESLIDRDYLERDRNNPSSYNYLA